ncbi:hypothetical protein [Scytonema sp. HK-05]|uniref:hypothetical protein n=1 Tax=Scytonema sp. HK-05 TaxID=1137095 RepID=UPI001E3D6BEC|nr:hypothetical protein [Scytonema sp. HK-05]
MRFKERLREHECVSQREESAVSGGRSPQVQCPFGTQCSVRRAIAYTGAPT